MTVYFANGEERGRISREENPYGAEDAEVYARIVDSNYIVDEVVLLQRL